MSDSLGERFSSPVGRFLSIFTLQFCAWWLLLLMNGATWWDDWVLKSLTPSELKDYFNGIGRPFFYPIHQLLMPNNGFGYHPLILITSFGISWMFYLILRSQLNERLAFASAAVLATLPMITTRVLAIFYPFVLGLFLFFVAWWLLVRNGGVLKRFERWLVFLLLFCAFTTASLLVWVLLPLGNQLLLRFRKVTLKSVVSYASENWLLLASPIVFWVVNRIFFKPFGWYQEYNNPLAFIHEPRMFIILVAVAMASLAISFFLIRRFNRGVSATLDLALVSVFSVLLGSIPYVAIGRNPWHFYGFADRFGLLYPYGISVLAGIGITYLIGRSKIVGNATAAFLIAALITLTNLGLSQYLLDNRVQVEIINQLRSNAAWRSAPTILVDNKASKLFANGRTNPHYELTGWLEAASGDRTHLAINADEIGVWVKLGHFSRVPKYGARDYVATKTGALVTITPTAGTSWPTALFQSKPLFKIEVQSIPELNAYYESHK